MRKDVLRATFDIASVVVSTCVMEACIISC